MSSLLPLLAQAITRRKQMEALLQITELMSAEISTEKVMQRIIEASYALVNAERIMLYSVDPQTKDLGKCWQGLVKQQGLDAWGTMVLLMLSAVFSL